MGEPETPQEPETGTEGQQEDAEKPEDGAAAGTDEDESGE